MKVLFCTPFKKREKNISGISIWANNMMDYYYSQRIDIDIDVLSQSVSDVFITKTTFILKRIWVGLLSYGKIYRQMKQMIKSTHYDVLHLCSSGHISLVKDYVYVKFAKKNSVKTVVHYHFGLIPKLAQKNNWEWKLIKRVIRLSDNVIVIDLKSKETLEKSGFNNVFYLPNPISQEVVDIINKEKASAKRQANHLLFVGHVIPTKGVYELVEACKDIPSIRLDVVGRIIPEVRTKMLDLAGDDVGWIHFKGELPRQEVIREMLSCGIFVLPTYTEGFPNVILESMACSCPIVTTDVGAIPEMLDVENNPCGICVVPKNVEELKSAIQHMLNDGNYAELCGERAAKRVNSNYSVDVVWKQLSNVWKS